MKTRLLAAVAVAAIAIPGVASAQWYGRIGVGYGTTQDIKLTDNPVHLGGRNIQSQGHWLPQLAIGYETGNGLRVELEGGHQWDDTGAVGNLPFSNSNIHTYSLMVNAIYDFDTGGGISPFLGVGAGALRQRLSAVAPSIVAPGVFGPATYATTDKDWSGAVQALAGVRFDTGSNLSTELRYRFLAAFDSDYANMAGPGSIEMKNFKSHDVIASLIWSFGTRAAPPPPPPPPPPPAPPPPPPPPPPAPACENVEFVVYFEWDRSDITDQAASVIQTAAQRARECGVASVQIDGHADRSGPAAYNVGLSQRRANSVSERLVQQGVPAGNITTNAYGESRPAVQTPDGVREPLNRRSEVIIRVNGASS